LTIHITKDLRIMRAQTSISIAILGIVSMATVGIRGQAAPIPPATAIPVTFNGTVEAGTAKPSEVVTATTKQAVYLPGGQVLPKGSTITGHVVESTALIFDSTSYAVQKASVLSIHFDKVVANGSTIPVSLSVRALSGPVQAREAETVHYAGEYDTAGTRVLVGGSSFTPLDSAVTSVKGDVTGYVRSEGVVARLIASDALQGGSRLHCGGTATEQSVDIFSADACGVYGLDTVSMPDNGSRNGAFVLESRRHNVRLYAGSAALLQVVTEPGALASL
jgi:hypothetical protein